MPAKPIGFNRFALIAIRESAKLTQDQVATDAECNPGFYSRLEKGERGCSAEVAMRLASALRCDVRALVPTLVVDDEVAA